MRHAVEATDRGHVRYAEAGEGIAHIAFADHAAQVGIVGGESLYRRALAAAWIVDLVNQLRAGDVHLDRPGVDASWHVLAGAGIEREHRVIPRAAGLKERGGAEAGLITGERFVVRH